MYIEDLAEKNKLNEAYKRVQTTEQREANEERCKNRKIANVAKRKDRMSQQRAKKRIEYTNNQ